MNEDVVTELRCIRKELEKHNELQKHRNTQLSAIHRKLNDIYGGL